jgi:hypothetical protein
MMQRPTKDILLMELRQMEEPTTKRLVCKARNMWILELRITSATSIVDSPITFVPQMKSFRASEHLWMISML